MTGGHTSLGRKINKISKKSEDNSTGQYKTARAIIITPYKDTYRFVLALLDDAGKITKNTAPVPLIGGDEQAMALLYGSPQNLSRGQGEAWEVIIFYVGNSVNRGAALITRRMYEVSTDKFEATKTSNELLAKGTSWAPPGSGLV